MKKEGVRVLKDSAALQWAQKKENGTNSVSVVERHPICQSGSRKLEFGPTA